MKSWFFNSIMALVCFGLWAFLPKISVKYINPRSALIYEVMGGVLMAFLVWTTMNKGLEYNFIGVSAAFCTGLIGYLGMLFFLYAVKVGTVSIIASLTAVYPAITVMLALIFLKEKIGLMQYLGMILAVVGIALLSYR